jgi:alkanesulfonate monooxygenase SsuD/methylene tetrahydromethanopterin reductase-like flavin-dependent oxidoreductase (luciferase family)
MEEIVLADQLGLDVVGIGEHHRPDYAVSAPSVILGAAAVMTKNIRLTSAVTVLSSDDPVRVFQQFAEVDLLSGGRAEIMAGRGSFIESFPLFGYDLQDYDELFTEKLDLLLALRKQGIPPSCTNANTCMAGSRRNTGISCSCSQTGAAADAGNHWRNARTICSLYSVIQAGGTKRRKNN